MPYQEKLDFICQVLEKCHVPYSFLDTNMPISAIISEAFRNLVTDAPEIGITFREIFERETMQTIWRLPSQGDVYFLFFLLPQRSQKPVMVLGPYLSENLDQHRVFEYGEKLGIAPANQKLLLEYYLSLPVLSESNPIFLMLDTFWEHIWGNSDFKMIDLEHDLVESAVVLVKKNIADAVNDIAVNMEIMERRYAYENELMRAVAQGHVHKLPTILDAFSDTLFEKRLSDQIRNMKNYCIIMNTLLRKAAEQGGVHPFYINETSSIFAIRIEQITSINGVREIMSDMFRSYCRLVRKHSMRNYSSTVQKVIARIDTDLSADLSLSTLAQQQNISPGYLSTIFKKETGKTITEYIINERMQFAMYLLSTTRLQIQTVALHCGIADVQYFSKIFKKHVGMTPKDYRKTMK